MKINYLGGPITGFIPKAVITTNNNDQFAEDSAAVPLPGVS